MESLTVDNGSKMNSNKKIVIFDLDGTILDSIEDLTDACNYCLEKYNMPKKTVNEVTQMVGNGIYKLVEAIVKKDTDAGAIKIVDSPIEILKEI